MKTKKKNGSETKKGADTMGIETSQANEERKPQQKVKFHVRAPEKSQVFVAGTFNNWDSAAIRMRRNGDATYAAHVLLPPGRHEYKFVINGEWLVDTENPMWTSNNMGSLNSVIQV